jgi:hypothetical protein
LLSHEVREIRVRCHPHRKGDGIPVGIVGDDVGPENRFVRTYLEGTDPEIEFGDAACTQCKIQSGQRC